LKEVSLSQDFYDFYEEIKPLGSGSMGEVKLCKHKERKEEYAVKIIKKAKNSSKDSDL
jgi:serine/threonine protein kinase